MKAVRSLMQRKRNKSRIHCTLALQNLKPYTLNRTPQVKSKAGDGVQSGKGA